MNASPLAIVAKLLLFGCVWAIKAASAEPINVYIKEGLYEDHFTVDVLVAAIPQLCKRPVLLWPRANFLADQPREAIIAATWGVTNQEASLFEGRNITVLHFSDEGLSHDSYYYNITQTVFRQYYTMDFPNMLAYLEDGANQTVWEHVRWIPLGYGKLKPMPLYKLPFPERTVFWCWSGSRSGKAERQVMLSSLAAAANNTALASIFDRSSLHSFDYFNGAGLFSPLQYSSLMHDTQFVPVPSGGSPEQYRIWECFEAGAIPIVLEHHTYEGRPLYPIKLLGFKYLTVSRWQELPRKLADIANGLSADMDMYHQMQQANTDRWNQIKARISNAIAHSVCPQTV